jgi:hypothetical protein
MTDLAGTYWRQIGDDPNPIYYYIIKEAGPGRYKCKWYYAGGKYEGGITMLTFEEIEKGLVHVPLAEWKLRRMK